jgi:YggT family protein
LSLTFSSAFSSNVNVAYGMPNIGAQLGYALTAFVLLLIARMVLDWAELLANGPQWVDRARTITHAGTEPIISPVRRLLHPVRAGGLSIDLAFTAVFVWR